MTPASIGAGLLGTVLPRPAARKFALAGFILACLLAVGAAVGAFKLWDWWDDRKAVSAAVTKANNETLTRTIEANEAAANERLGDAARLSAIEKGYRDALHDPPPGTALSARQRHACQQLRTQGFGETDLPALCRHAGAGGGAPESRP